MNIFNCNPEWPICLYDFTFERKNPTQLTIRMGKPLQEYLVDDYFYSYDQATFQKHEELFDDCQEDNFTNTRDEILMERGHHLCNLKHFPFFVENFKIRFQARDPTLFRNCYIHGTLKDDTNIPFIHADFIRQVSEPLTTELICLAKEDRENGDQSLVFRRELDDSEELNWVSFSEKEIRNHRNGSLSDVQLAAKLSLLNIAHSKSLDPSHENQFIGKASSNESSDELK